MIAIPMATLNTTETAWEVNLKTSVELYTIWEMTGVLDQPEGIDENLFDVITDIMDEKREDWADFLEEQEEEDYPSPDPANAHGFSRSRAAATSSRANVSSSMRVRVAEGVRPSWPTWDLRPRIFVAALRIRVAGSSGARSGNNSSFRIEPPGRGWGDFTPPDCP